MATVTLLTAEEYARLPEEQYRQSELVRGVIVPMNPPRFRHGEICYRVARLVGDYVDDHKLGRIVTNDSGVITERDPDTVRGPDVAYFSYARLPRETEVELYPPVAPDLAIEVRSPDDGWPMLHRKAAEYLAAGVTVVMVVDYEAESVTLFYADKAVRTLKGDEELALPEVLGDFRVSLGQLWE